MDKSKHAMNAVAADISVVSSKATENKVQSTKIKFKSELILAISRELGELATSSISSESN